MAVFSPFMAPLTPTLPARLGKYRRRREPVVITKKGVAVAKLVPADAPTAALFGCLAGEIEIVGDIVAPIVPPEAWEAMKP